MKYSVQGGQRSSFLRHFRGKPTRVTSLDLRAVTPPSQYTKYCSQGVAAGRTKWKVLLLFVLYSSSLSKKNKKNVFEATTAGLDSIPYTFRRTRPLLDDWIETTTTTRLQRFQLSNPLNFNKLNSTIGEDQTLRHSNKTVAPAGDTPVISLCRIQ